MDHTDDETIRESFNDLQDSQDSQIKYLIEEVPKSAPQVKESREEEFK